MWVADALRGRGLAWALMTAAEDEARRRGCALVVFHAYDLLAPGLYERFGYETVGSLRAVRQAARPAGTGRSFADMSEAPVRRFIRNG